MHVSLTPAHEQFIQEKVASGEYPSRSEVISEALRFLEEQDRLRQLRLEALRREIDVGLEQSERGQVVKYDEESLRGWFEEIKVKGRQKLAERRKQQST